MKSAIVIGLLLTATTAQGEPVMTASQAIRAAERSPTAYGVATIVVRSTGNDQDILFLNSEADYHNPLNLTVALLPSAISDLRKQHGDDLAGYFIGKTVWVSGRMARVPIGFLNDNGSPKHVGYYQHRVTVISASNISLMPPK